jgi:hypothetical protein
MKQTLGKTIKLFLILIFTSFGFAEVKVSLSSATVYEGDTVNFIITADGNDISFPKINEIEGNPILGRSSSESISMINTKITRTTSKTYSFRVSKSLVIPAFIVQVDGKEYKTKELTLNVLKPTASKKGSEFMVELSLDKNESYVGEALTLSISFKAKHNARADQVQLGEPKLEDFWVKKKEEITHTTEGDYIVQTLHYTLFPQKSGEYTIPAIETLVGKVARRQRHSGGFFDDPVFNSMSQPLNWQKVYSNRLKLKVKPLPQGLELYGNYQIQAEVDKQKVEANKPVNLSISVKGEGNIDDVKKFELDIANVIIYADEPKITSKEVHGIYQGVFREKIALIADQNFTIPALTLEYFDKVTKTVKTVHTEPIDIEVLGATKTTANQASTIEVSPSQIVQTPAKIKTKIVMKKEDAYLKYLFLAIGVILGILLMVLVNLLSKNKKKQEVSIIKMIKRAKDDRTLFNLLLPYSKEHKRISNALNQLEENLYKGTSHKIDKEDLMDFFEERELKGAKFIDI